MKMHVRHAIRSDADAIATAHIAAWRAAYGDIFPAAVFDADDFDSSRRDMWRAWGHSPTADWRLQVVVVDGRVGGFSHTGDSDDDQSQEAVDPADRFGELFGFYVHPDTWGTGAVRLLMDAALAHLAEIGHERAVVWTLSGATRARRFYVKTGWVETGRTGMWDRYPAHPVPELELARTL